MNIMSYEFRVNIFELYKEIFMSRGTHHVSLDYFLQK